MSHIFNFINTKSKKVYFLFVINIITILKKMFRIGRGLNTCGA